MVMDEATTWIGKHGLPGGESRVHFYGTDDRPVAAMQGGTRMN
jgi:hypothetical protein